VDLKKTEGNIWTGPEDIKKNLKKQLVLWSKRAEDRGHEKRPILGWFKDKRTRGLEDIRTRGFKRPEIKD
jgi:hypothetical protein